MKARTLRVVNVRPDHPAQTRQHNNQGERYRDEGAVSEVMGVISMSVEGLDPESWSAWLIERGQPEGHVPPIYAVTWTKDGDATVTDWTDDPFRAAQIPDKAEAEKLMGLWNSAPARVVQHGFTCEHRESRCLHCERIVPRNDTPKPEPEVNDRG